jgi:acetyl-CoA acetyltransferase
VADPLRLLHCCPISDGAAAVVLRREHTRVRVAGIGQGWTRSLSGSVPPDELSCDPDAAQGRLPPWPASPPPACRRRRIHDAFAPFELDLREDIRPLPGKAGRATLDGDTALDATPRESIRRPQARGHPMAATGLAQIVECVWQLTGKAEDGSSMRGSASPLHRGLATNTLGSRCWRPRDRIHRGIALPPLRNGRGAAPPYCTRHPYPCIP